MKIKKSIPAIFVLSLFLLASCQNQASDPQAKYPIELQWVRNSVEYQILCVQSYQTAWKAVKKNAAGLQENWTVVLDVDETVLDNSRYQEILFEKNQHFPYYWDEWVLRAECPPVPGAKAFLDSVRSLGKFAHVTFISNRNTPLEDATRQNLKSAGLWAEGDVLLCQNDRSDTKQNRRREVMEGTGRCQGMGKRTIVALFGDQLGDLQDYPEGIAVSEYKSYFMKVSGWGEKYFLLPNPMYGYWTRGYRR